MKRWLALILASLAAVAVMRSAIEAISSPRVRDTAAVPAAVVRDSWLAANQSGQALDVPAWRSESVHAPAPKLLPSVEGQSEHWAALGTDASATELAHAGMAALTDVDAEARVQAIELLGDARQSQYVAILASALADPNREVRLAAVHALARHGTDEALGVMRAGLTSFDEDDRQFGLAMLADLHGDASP
jgi:HEAT repeat protein